MQNILFISYYFPPQGLSGVLRSLKFVKYLPEFGFRPIVLAGSGFSFFAQDKTLLEDIPEQAKVVRVGSPEPYSLGFSNPGRIRNSASSLAAWLPVPDTRFFWSVKAKPVAQRLIQQHKIGLVIASSPPQSSLVLAGRLGLPFILDYRDLWHGNFERKIPTRLHARLQQRWERDLLNRARAVIVINKNMARQIEKFYGLRPRIIPLGYDPEDFKENPPALARDVLRVFYAGSFVRKRRPDTMFKAMRDFMDQNPKARVKLTWAGTSSWDVVKIARDTGVQQHFEALGYVDHRTSCELMQQNHLLWVLVGPGEGPEVSTAKAYEYLGAGRSLLITAPKHTDAASLAFEHGAYWAEPDRPEHIAEVLKTAWKDLQSNRLRVPVNTQAFQARSRTQRLAQVIREALKNENL